MYINEKLQINITYTCSKKILEYIYDTFASRVSEESVLTDII